MKIRWEWALQVPTKDNKEPSITKRFATRDEAETANDNSAKVVRLMVLA